MDGIRAMIVVMEIRTHATMKSIGGHITQTWIGVSFRLGTNKNDADQLINQSIYDR
jgi:hypothetical protein